MGTRQTLFKPITEVFKNSSAEAMMSHRKFGHLLRLGANGETGRKERAGFCVLKMFKSCRHDIWAKRILRGIAKG